MPKTVSGGEISQSTASEELGKYFQLGIDGAPMFGKYIDAHWHSMREDRESYEAFCMEKVGRIVEHREWETPDPVYYELTWVNSYHQKFGELPLVWFALEDGSIDKELHQSYLNTNKIERLPPRIGPLLTCDCKF